MVELSMGKQVRAAILYTYQNILKTYLFPVQFQGLQNNSQQTEMFYLSSLAFSFDEKACQFSRKS